MVVVLMVVVVVIMVVVATNGSGTNGSGTNSGTDVTMVAVVTIVFKLLVNCFYSET